MRAVERCADWLNEKKNIFEIQGNKNRGIKNQIWDLTSDTNCVSWGLKENSEASLLATKKKMAAVLDNFKDND